MKVPDKSAACFFSCPPPCYTARMREEEGRVGGRKKEEKCVSFDGVSFSPSFVTRPPTGKKKEEEKKRILKRRCYVYKKEEEEEE